MSDILKGKLENQEIRKEISEYEFSSGFKPYEKLIDDLIEQFWFHDFYNSFISNHVFLKYLCQYLNKTKPTKFSRYDFYKFLFDQIPRDSRNRKLLHQIALSFEMLQTDALEPDHYGSLLKAVNAPKEIFDASWMEKKHLAKISEREDKKLFIWEHHSLTEFLVAEYLLSYKNFLEEFQKLAILEQEGITAFKPSWLGVLRFLMESKRSQEVISWLVEFLEKHPDNIDDNFTELLVYEATEQTTQIKFRIFKLVYDCYFQRLVWLPVWARSRIAKYIGPEIYKRLKEDLKEWSNTTETFVRRGNVVSIVEGLFEYKNPLITESEKKFWREKLIDFANNPRDDGNGVLQRHSLAVLAYFKDKKIIPLVAQKCFDETQDSLIRDEFVQFCYNSAPNSKVAIDYFIKGVKKGSTIYARHGLYKINTKEALEYLLSKISQDEEFLKAFLKHESIFDKEGADQELIKNIEEKTTPKIIEETKKIIFTILRIDDYYKEGQSNFLHKLVQFINKQDSEYLFEVLEDIQKEEDEQKIDRLFWDSKELLALLLTKDNVEQYFKFLENLSDRVKRDAQYAVYASKRLNGEIGEQVYQEAVKLGLVEAVDEGSQKDFDEQQKKRKQEIYNSFINQLEPSPGEYMPGVFEYFLQKRKDIEEQWKEEDKKRLIKLSIEEGVKKIDPRQFKVHVDKSTRQFNWSSVASYFGSVLSVVNALAPEEIQKYRQQIIDFIPYAFSDDMSRIMDLIPDIKDAELEFVNKVMSDEKDDRRYLIPSSYIYIVGHYAKKGCKIPSVKPVLLSFIGDKHIPDYEQKSAIEVLPLLIDSSDNQTRELLTNIFEDEEVNGQKTKLAEAANTVLIQTYKDGTAINWRIEQIKKPLLLDRSEGAHTPSDEELEIDWMSFAKPLLELRDEKYLQKFLELLTYSFKVIEEKRDKKYWEYVNYLWRIAIGYVENLKENGSFKPLLTLEDWVSKNAPEKDSNWLKARINELRKVYISSIGQSNIKL